jgi:hypothetical protein
MKLKPLLPLLLVISGGCVELIEFNGVPIRQYASSVIAFSSQYSPTTWSAAQALGKQNVHPSYGDINKAWASLKADESREFLVLGLDTPQTAKTIEIYETYNPGAIDSVFVRRADSGDWIKVYSKPVVTDLPKESRVFTIFLNEATFLVDAIRIAINSPDVDGWNEIDAVALTGQREE